MLFVALWLCCDEPNVNQFSISLMSPNTSGVTALCPPICRIRRNCQSPPDHCPFPRFLCTGKSWKHQIIRQYNWATHTWWPAKQSNCIPLGSLGKLNSIYNRPAIVNYSNQQPNWIHWDLELADPNWSVYTFSRLTSWVNLHTNLIAK